MKGSGVETVESAERALRILELLLQADFASGLTAAQVQREVGISATATGRYLKTLVGEGFAEVIEETGRYRPAVRLARYAVGIAHSLEESKRRTEELAARIQTRV